MSGTDKIQSRLLEIANNPKLLEKFAVEYLRNIILGFALGFLFGCIAGLLVLLVVR